MRKAKVESVKAFASRQVDIARPAYGRFVLRQKPYSIEVGTTNNNEYLHSQTGNHRFWPMVVRQMIDIDKLRRDRLQLWGEAANHEAAGESTVLDKDLWRAAGAEQEERRTKDPREEITAEFLDGASTAASENPEVKQIVNMIYREDGEERVKSSDLLVPNQKPMGQIELIA
jgi:predicted P-loop ATPase